MKALIPGALACLILILIMGGAMAMRPSDQAQERTCFQSGMGYADFIDLKTDVAIPYGIDAASPERIESWQREGYITHLMTGVSWGEYQDYLYGRFDGINHEDEAQTERNGNKVSHGGDVYYMCPGINFGKFLSVGVKRAIDAGAQAIHLEEPEFWVRSGYSEGFKREWQDYYGEAWIAPHSSPDAQYRASKLKYYLYRRALGQVFDFVVDYSKEIGRDVKCYVPTHSLINYASWGIVSPESSLVLLNGCDGYIAQVWTGTARTPNTYRNVAKERTFETAFFEYGAAQNLVRATGRRVWFLHDPIEDNPNHSWEDYKRNYECTLVASLLWPDTAHYEVVPWPHRVFRGAHNLTDQPDSPQVEIPQEYATELLTCFNHLRDMDWPENEWLGGVPGFGVMVSDTLMFQRGNPDGSDGRLGNFYGLCLPLFKRGIALEPVQLENVTVKDYLKPFKVIMHTYEGQKPMEPVYHEALAAWVKAGGVLVFVDDQKDPYNAVTEWWNSDGKDYKGPAEHLFETLGLGRTPAVGDYEVGKGWVLYRAESPAALTYQQTGDQLVAEVARQAAAKASLKWREANYVALRRGPYLVAAGLDESVDAPAKVVKGKLVDLFSPTLEVKREVTLEPNTRHWLLDMGRLPSKGAQVLASASRISRERAGKGYLEFVSEGPTNTQAATRVLLPREPKRILVSGGKAPDVMEWDAATKTFLLKYENTARPRYVFLGW